MHVLYHGVARINPNIIELIDPKEIHRSIVKNKSEVV